MDYPAFQPRPTEQPFVLIAGPCVVEEDGAINRQAAETLKAVVARLPESVSFYFKSSYDKANRTSANTRRGPGLQQGLAILREIKDTLGVRILTDVHAPEEVSQVAAVADMIQIPAFLCRQTDLLLEAGRSGLPVNIKKGQFLSPYDVGNCAEKVASTGNTQIYITERGTTFGYNNLVVDLRSIPIVQDLNLPLIFDATHSVQLPGGQGGASGGQRQFAPVLGRAAVAAGCNGLFFETHPTPDRAHSDGPNQIPLEWIEPFLDECFAIRAALRQVGNRQPISTR
jgi:2-dehydro-3-deoxyphosphooctonate aldolase (KDO 8-P synthase)